MAQKKVNTYGYKMENLRDLCAMTKGMTKYSNYFICIAWDPENGKIIYREFVGNSMNSWVEWEDYLIGCGTIATQMTQQEIADQIKESIDVHKQFIDPNLVCATEDM